MKRRIDDNLDGGGGITGVGTAFNSTYEEINPSPRMEQRFDVKLESKYVKGLKLKTRKLPREPTEELISVVGVGMK